VGAAYERLVAEGFLAARAGVGTYVSDGVPAGRRTRRPTRAPAIRTRPVWDGQPEPEDMSAVNPVFDFRPGIPDARYFPFATWRALLADALREASVGAGAYTDPAGHVGLRAAIARHIGVSRAVSATAEDVLVTSGTQQAVDLIGRVLLEPGDVAVVEDPGWVPPRVLLETMGARVVRVPVDGEGLVVEALPERTRVVHVSPSHQFPLGVAMSLRRRLALLGWAERTGAVIIEDDYDSEFRYVGRPVEPLHSLDRSGQVLYVGSLSKTLLPTLRLGFCVAPPSLHLALRKAKFVADWHTILPVQAALARYIDQGGFARHIRRMRRVYQERHDRIAEILARDFTDVLAPIPSVAGLHLSAHLRNTTVNDQIDDEALVDQARRAGVGVYPVSIFGSAASPHRGLILGYGAISLDRIDEGLRLLRRCLQQTDAARL
jgi:GntR family transcriptional regulator/MocR family aminotransferase